MLAAAAPAQASFHLIKVREVFPGSSSNPDSDYVVLQMYSAGQNLVNLGELEVLNSAGTVTSQFTPGSTVPNSANQSTVLIVNSGFSGRFPGIAPDFTDAGLNLSPAGGAVCWPQTEPPFDDCASWGNFTGQASLPLPGDAAPATSSGIPDGMAIGRTIAPGCATLLENGDDTNRSSVDFSPQSPNPRNNATSPAEHECPALPNTVIDVKPANPTKATTASFTYHAVPAAEAEFECRLDTAAFASCPTAGIEYAGPLAQGGHMFEVRATNSAGTDGTPAAFAWTVDTTPPTATIDSHPIDPSPGGSAAFTYHANEVGSKFECSLASGGGLDGFVSCPASGRTYTNLADGVYTFKVRATDAAGNQGTPEPMPTGTFTWTVDSMAPDTTPPETTIQSKPPNPSSSSTALFTYESNEPGSTFECMLDGSGFAPCPAAGVTYIGLDDGPHAFAVRAIDPSDNVDQTPAGYSFDVVLPVEGPSLPAVGLAPPAPLPPASVPATVPAARAGPETTISGKPGARTRDRTPTFRFHSSQPGAGYECKLDRKPYKPCGSPFTTKSLPYGRHTLLVRTVVGEIADPSPAKFQFKVVRG